MSQKWSATFLKQIRKGGMFLLRILIVLSILAPNVSAAAQAASENIKGRLFAFKKSDAIPVLAELFSIPAGPGKNLAAEMSLDLQGILFAILQKNTVRPLEDTPQCATSGELEVDGITCFLVSGTYTYTNITVRNSGTISLTGNMIVSLLGVVSTW